MVKLQEDLLHCNSTVASVLYSTAAIVTNWLAAPLFQFFRALEINQLKAIAPKYYKQAPSMSRKPF